ncbi:MAG: putative lipopolysaccharide heptosyltransferase III [Syntrophobacteraceae bacterium]
MNRVPLPEIRSALFIKLRHIGDVLLTAGTFKALKAASSSVRIDVLVPSGTESMLTLHPSIDEVIPMKRGAGWIEDLRLIRRLRSGGYDLAVNMTEGDRGTILAFLSGAQYRFGVDPRHKGFWGKRHLLTHLIKPVYDGRHRALMDLDVLAPLGIRAESAEVELYVSEEDQHVVDEWLTAQGLGEDKPFIVVHPTSRWLFKCWKDEAVARVVDHFESGEVRVIVTSGPDGKEKEKLASILRNCSTRPVTVTGRFSLKQYAALLRRSRLFFGVDTAPMHMAAALGKPVVALFGPSDSKVWGPLTPLGRILDRGEEFPCLPCRRDGCGGTKQSACLEAISPEEAIAAIDGILRG